MALYAIGDLHLQFEARHKVPMQQSGPVWGHHEEKVKKNCARLIRPEDTLVLVGDHSWGRKIEECRKDLQFIEALPGRKILTRGNHDMFWDAGKTEKLNQAFEGRLFFLQNNFASYKDYALVGTKGYCFENLDSREHAAKLVERELVRLRISFECARAAGYRKFIMFLHYPPTSILLHERESGFTRIAEEYRAEQVVYAHCHGKPRFHDSIQGPFHGVNYSLVSGDYLLWKPKRIL